MPEFLFVPDYAVEADTVQEAFEKAIDAIEKDIEHYREYGTTQIEWVTTDEIAAGETAIVYPF